MQSKKDTHSLSLTLTRIVLIVTGILTIILNVLSLIDVFKDGQPLLVFFYIVVLLCMSRLEWDERRGLACFLLGGAILLFIGFIVMLLLG